MPNPNSFNYYMPTYGQQQASNYYPNYYPVQQGAQPQSYVNGYQPPISQAPPMRGITGRIVSSLEEITPNEVPMDRSVSFFPTSDYSCIYAKQWDSDGTIKTVKYVPEVQEAKVIDEQVDIVELISTRFDKLESMLNKPTMNNTPNNQRRGENKKKEG